MALSEMVAGLLDVLHARGYRARRVVVTDVSVDAELEAAPPERAESGESLMARVLGREDLP